MNKGATAKLKRYEFLTNLGTLKSATLVLSCPLVVRYSITALCLKDSHLHLLFNSFKGEGERLSDSCCKTAIDEVLQRCKANMTLLPQLIQIDIHRIAANGEGNSTYPQ